MVLGWVGSSFRFSPSGRRHKKKKKLRKSNRTGPDPVWVMHTGSFFLWFGVEAVRGVMGPRVVSFCELDLTVHGVASPPRAGRGTVTWRYGHPRASLLNNREKNPYFFVGERADVANKNFVTWQRTCEAWRWKMYSLISLK